ncbi:sensor domain-containing protein [Salinadaptatus halalkaliphilus]|nr:sensor domain-containing protein [Salinadaptatus halalkaliphilus]
MSRSVATATGDRFGRVGAGCKRFLAVPFERQTYRNLAYLLLAFPLGLAYFVFVTVAFSVGIGFSVTIIGLVVGVPILAVTLALALGIAGFERWLTATMLAVDIEPKTDLAGETALEACWSVVSDPKTWTAVCYLPAKFVLGVASFALVVTGLSTAVSLLMLPLYYDQPGLYVGVVSERAPEFHQTLYLGWNYLLVGFDAVVTLGYWEVTTLSEALVAAGLGVVLLLATLHALNLLARVSGWFARLLLEDSYDPLAVVQRPS